LDSYSFIALVLVPELTNILIAEDQDLSYEDANKMRLESSDFGVEQYPDLDDDPIQRQLVEVDVIKFLENAGIINGGRCRDVQASKPPHVTISILSNTY
jgi:hypothetical protein